MVIEVDSDWTFSKEELFMPRRTQQIIGREAKTASL